MQLNIFHYHNIIWIALLSLVFGSPVIAKLIELYAKRKAKSKRKITSCSIRDHQFFDYMDYCLKLRIKQMDFGSEFKTNAFRDILYLHFLSFKDNLKVYTDVCLVSKSPARLFQRKITNVFYETIEMSETKWHKLDIPEIKYITKRFSIWHSVTMDFVLKYTKRVMESHVYKNDYERINAVLDIYTTAFEVIILDVESGLRRVNGKFKGLEYKSKIF